MTEKKLRKHLRRIWFHWYRLQDALNAAHEANVIVYPNGNDKKTVCGHHWETRKAVEYFTAGTIADTIQNKIRQESGGW
jgi:hypothetical protein